MTLRKNGRFFSAALFCEPRAPVQANSVLVRKKTERERALWALERNDNSRVVFLEGWPQAVS
jgi:hypothetical protein